MLKGRSRLCQGVLLPSEPYALSSADRVEHRIVFGFIEQIAPKLVEFLRRHPNDLTHAKGIRYSAELGHPNHVVDEPTVLLPFEEPFVLEGRFGSMLWRTRSSCRALPRNSTGSGARPCVTSGRSSSVSPRDLRLESAEDEPRP